MLSLSYGKIIVKPAEKLRGLIPESFETYQILEPGDIVVRPTDLQNDKTSLRVGHASDRGIITSAYLAMRTSGVSDSYAFAYLAALDQMKIFYGMGTGLRQNIELRDFKRLPVAVPPVDEQAAIVKYLGHAHTRIDRAISAKRNLIALLKEQQLAVIHRSVTRGLDSSVPLRDSGIPWLGETPAHWPIIPIRYLARVGNGSTPSRSESEYWVGGDYPWLNSSVANEAEIRHASQFVTQRALDECHLPKVAANSVLVAITGQGKTRGKAAVLTLEATINQHLAYITPRSDQVDCRYLASVLDVAYGELRRISDDSGSTKGALTCADLKAFAVPVPPIEEQQGIRRFVAEVATETETLVARLASEIDLLREFRTRLTSDVATGQLDVREIAVTLPELSDDALPDVDDELDELVEAELQLACDDE
ncbi:restriction endonuclease subunit S [Agromyces albus]|uniref:restriction endonuclease subunit S n=1 Tax=Agromyces albus TaxID=205332 RepID=UPI0013E94541|nr:restriction endonuclease subunit S [Agromyces albus]